MENILSNNINLCQTRRNPESGSQTSRCVSVVWSCHEWDLSHHSWCCSNVGMVPKINLCLAENSRNGYSVYEDGCVTVQQSRGARGCLRSLCWHPTPIPLTQPQQKKQPQLTNSAVLIIKANLYNPVICIQALRIANVRNPFYFLKCTH